MKEKPSATHFLITGGTGFIGRHLTNALIEKNYTVSHLSRGPGNDPLVKTFLWDVANGKIDEQCINGVDIIIHLAGSGIADKRWSRKRKKEIVESRTKSIELIYDVIKSRPNKVSAIISAVAVGYYGDRGDELLTEESLPGDGFMPECCLAWEKAVDQGKDLGLRVVKFRTGVVLDKKAGALPKMAMPVNLFAGSAFGSGKQWVPWIHWEDVVAMYLVAIGNINMTGVYNMAAPEAATNKQLMRTIARELHKPLWPINVPAFVFKLLMGEMSVIVLGSARVSAQKIQDEGFTFKYPDLAGALKQIYG